MDLDHLHSRNKHALIPAAVAEPGDELHFADARESATGDSDQTFAAKPKSPMFQSANRTRFPADQAKRQGDITSIAFRHFGSRDAAIAFLNSPHRALTGRPIDVATGSAEGFASVERAIAGLAPL